jgi:hypothetical protein
MSKHYCVFLTSFPNYYIYLGFHVLRASRSGGQLIYGRHITIALER